MKNICLLPRGGVAGHSRISPTLRSNLPSSDLVSPLGLMTPRPVRMCQVPEEREGMYLVREGCSEARWSGSQQRRAGISGDHRLTCLEPRDSSRSLIPGNFCHSPLQNYPHSFISFSLTNSVTLVKDNKHPGAFGDLEGIRNWKSPVSTFLRETEMAAAPFSGAQTFPIRPFLL